MWRGLSHRRAGRYDAAGSMHLRSLSPLGPIFGKELRSTARRRRTYVLRVVYLLALLLVLLLVWSENRARHWEGLLQRTESLNRMGHSFFAAFGFFSVIAMVLIGPVLTSTAVSAERLGKTLNVLLMTPLSSWQIACGKLLSRVLVALTLIGLSLPVLAVVRLLGGVEIGQMLAAVVLCATTVLATASLGLLLSTLLTRAYATILLSYAALLFVYAFLPFAATLLAVRDMGRAGPPSGYFEFLTLTNPVFTMASVILEGSTRGLITFSAWWHCAVSHLAMAAGLLTVTAMILRRRARGESSSGVSTAPTGPPPPLPRSADAPELPAPMRPAWPAPVGRSVSNNPVLWREVRRPLMGRSWQRVSAGVLFGLLLVSSYILIGMAERPSPLRHAETQTAYACIFCGLLTLMTCILSATSIAQEKESDTWMILLATPLSGRQIVMGKVLGLLRRLGWPSLFFLAHLVLFTLTGAIPAAGLLVCLWVMVTFNSIFIVSGVALSLWVRKTTTAVVLNLLLPIILYLGTWIALVVGGEVLDTPRHSRGETVLAWLPYNYIYEGVYGISRRDRAYDYGTSTHRGVRTRTVEPFGQMTLVDFLAITFAVGSAHVLLSAACLSWLVARFDAIVGRAGRRAGGQGVARPA